LSLNGIIVLNEGGSTIYSKIVGEKFNIDPISFGPLLEAIQIFARNLDQDRNLTIEEMVILGFRLKYRHFENLTFIGIIDPKESSKKAEISFEYMIWAFLSKFRLIFEEGKNVYITSHFQDFDLFFLEYRSAKEKKLKKWVEKHPYSKFQGILIKMTNYFPISEIVKISPNRLKIIGKKLIWVDINIKSDEIKKIIDKLKEKTALIYGLELFKIIEEEVEEILPNITRTI